MSLSSVATLQYMSTSSTSLSFSKSQVPWGCLSGMRPSMVQKSSQFSLVCLVWSLSLILSGLWYVIEKMFAEWSPAEIEATRATAPHCCCFSPCCGSWHWTREDPSPADPAKERQLSDVSYFSHLSWAVSVSFSSEASFRANN